MKKNSGSIKPLQPKAKPCRKFDRVYGLCPYKMEKTGSGDRTRTCNNSINSRVRYQLRHTGIEIYIGLKH